MLLAATFISFYFLRDTMGLPEGFLWLWIALIIFCSVSFLFLLVIFIITLVKKNLRITYWVPVSFISCMAFLVLAALMFIGPSIMQPQFVNLPVGEVETSSSSLEEVGNEDAETAMQPEETEESVGISIFEIGDTFKIGDLQFTVNGVRTSEADKYSNKPPEESYVFLFIDTTIENLGNEEEYIHPDNNFRLVDKNGRDYSFVWAEGEGSIEGILAPGRKITGEQSYGIPKDINEYELEVFNYGAVESEVAIVEISIIQ